MSAAVHLTLTPEQAQAVTDACELYGRMGIGQLEEREVFPPPQRDTPPPAQPQLPLAFHVGLGLTLPSHLGYSAPAAKQSRTFTVKKAHGQRPNRDRSHDTAEPIVPLQGGIDSTADANHANDGSAKHPGHALDKHKPVDPDLLGAPGLRLGLSFVEDPIHQVRAYLMEPFDGGNGNQRGVGVIVPQLDFPAGLILSANGRLAIGHVSGFPANRCPRPASRRADWRHQPENRRHWSCRHALGGQSERFHPCRAENSEDVSWTIRQKTHGSHVRQCSKNRALSTCPVRSPISQRRATAGLQAYALACAAPKGALRSTLELALPAGLGYTACTSKEVGLKSPEKSGSRARQTLRFFCARTLLNGRGCDGYKTLRGKKSAKLFLGFEPPAASDGCAQNALFEVVYQRLEKERFMAQSVPALAPILAVVDGVPTTTSADVARHFGKPHHRVLDAIRNLLPQLPDGGVPNFRETPYTDPQNGQTYPAYRLTRDGFTLLAMGFTGKKALAFKLAYIDAFNKMEQALHTSDPERVKLAQSLAAEVAAVASRTVFEAVLAGDADWRINRWLFSLNYDRKDGGLTRPLAQAIGHDQMVVSMKELPGRILEPGGMWASSEELASLAAACTQKLAQRFQTKSASGPLQEKAISYQHGSEKETA